MPAELLCDKPDVSVWHATWEELLPKVGDVDAVIVDAPYSKRTHAGHDEKAKVQNRNGDTDGFREIDYEAWDEKDVAAFVRAWEPKARSWFVTITDHVLVPAWEAELAAKGRYVFSPIAYIAPRGPRVAGDGPAQWTTWIIAARPKEKRFLGWGSLPGGYVLPHGFGGRPRVAGGKSQWLMDRLVEHYSRPGDLIADPCCGGGSTLLGALRTGRRAIGGDMKREHAEIAAAACGAMVQRPMFMEGA